MKTYLSSGDRVAIGISYRSYKLMMFAYHVFSIRRRQGQAGSAFLSRPSRLWLGTEEADNVKAVNLYGLVWCQAHLPEGGDLPPRSILGLGYYGFLK